jgi:hypothetical protein
MLLTILNMNPIDLALNSVANSRLGYLQTLRTAAIDRDTQPTLALTYQGYANGQHWAKTQDGGTVPIEAVSNGAIETGQMLVGTKSATQVFGHWMPR